MTRTLSFSALFVAACLAGPAAAQQTTPQPGESEGEQREGRRGGGGFSGAVDYLTRELDLDEDQQAQVREIFDKAMQDSFRRMAQSWGEEGEQDPDAMRRGFEDMRLALTAQIREVLTPQQMREFEVVVEQFDQRASGWEQSRKLEDDPTQVFDPVLQSKRILLAKAERALFLGPDETVVVMGYVTAVIDNRQAMVEGRQIRRRDLLTAIESGASASEVRQRLQEIRTAEQFQSLELAASEQELRQLLTIEQEARFVTMGVLE